MHDNNKMKQTESNPGVSNNNNTVFKNPSESAANQKTSTTNGPAGRKILRKIVIDPEKLKSIGLNRKIAQALGNKYQNSNSTDVKNADINETAMDSKFETLTASTANTTSEAGQVENIKRKVASATSIPIAKIRPKVKKFSTIGENCSLINCVTGIFAKHRPDLDYRSLPASVRLKIVKTILRKHINIRLNNKLLEKELQYQQEQQQNTYDIATTNVDNCLTSPSSYGSSSCFSDDSLMTTTTPPPKLATANTLVVDHDNTSKYFSAITTITTQQATNTTITTTTTTTPEAITNKTTTTTVPNTSQLKFDQKEDNLFMPFRPAVVSPLKMAYINSNIPANTPLPKISTLKSISPNSHKTIVLEDKILDNTEKFDVSALQTVAKPVVITNETFITPAKHIEAHIEQKQCPGNIDSRPSLNAVDFLQTFVQNSKNSTYVLTEREKKRLMRNKKLESEKLTTLISKHNERENKVESDRLCARKIIDQSQTAAPTELINAYTGKMEFQENEEFIMINNNIENNYLHNQQSCVDEIALGKIITFDETTIKKDKAIEITKIEDICLGEFLPACKPTNKSNQSVVNTGKQYSQVEFDDMPIVQEAVSESNFYAATDQNQSYFEGYSLDNVQMEVEVTASCLEEDVFQLEYQNPKVEETLESIPPCQEERSSSYISNDVGDMKRAQKVLESQSALLKKQTKKENDCLEKAQFHLENMAQAQEMNEKETQSRRNSRNSIHEAVDNNLIKIASYENEKALEESESNTESRKNSQGSIYEAVDNNLMQIALHSEENIQNAREKNKSKAQSIQALMHEEEEYKPLIKIASHEKDNIQKDLDMIESNIAYSQALIHDQVDNNLMKCSSHEEDNLQVDLENSESRAKSWRIRRVSTHETRRFSSLEVENMKAQKTSYSQNQMRKSSRSSILKTDSSRKNSQNSRSSSCEADTIAKALETSSKVQTRKNCRSSIIKTETPLRYSQSSRSSSREADNVSKAFEDQSKLHSDNLNFSAQDISETRSQIADISVNNMPVANDQVSFPLKFQQELSKHSDHFISEPEQLEDSKKSIKWLTGNSRDIPLKKRWDIATQNSRFDEDIEITDDTSPADDSDHFDTQTDTYEDVEKELMKKIKNEKNPETEKQLEQIETPRKNNKSKEKSKRKRETRNTVAEQSTIKLEEKTEEHIEKPKLRNSKVETFKITTSTHMSTRNSRRCEVLAVEQTEIKRRGRKKRQGNAIDDKIEDCLPAATSPTTVASNDKATNKKTTITDYFSGSPEANFVKPMVLDNSSQKKRGRQQAHINFNPRLLLICQRSQLDTDEKLTVDSGAVKKDNRHLQCGLCLAIVAQELWVSHLSEHYGVGWQVGEPALDVTSRSVILTTMMGFLKETKIKAMSCRMCSRAYRSGLGLLMHVENCGVPQEKSECEFCGKKLLSSSIEVHRIACEAKHTHKNNPSEAESEENRGQVQLNISGRQKRKSTIKAENNLKKLKTELSEIEQSEPETKSIEYQPPLPESCRNKWLEDLHKFYKSFCIHKRCTFSSDNCEALEQHYYGCKYTRPVGYYCLKCQDSKKSLNPFATEEEALLHLKNKHKKHWNAINSDGDFNVSTDDGSSGVDENETEESKVLSSEEEDQKRKIIKKRKSTATVGGRKRFFPARTDAITMAAQRYRHFLNVNFAKTTLFEHFHPNYTVMNDLGLEYLLPNELTSMKFCLKDNPAPVMKLGVQPLPENCIELQRFQTIEYNAECFMYFGANINCLEWVPLPDDMSEQYFCVCYRQSGKYTRFINPQLGRDVILVYKVPVTQSNCAPELRLQYAFCVPNGPIHCLAFLPSGGFDEKTNRLGVLAVGTADSPVNIYALPIDVPEEVEMSDSCIKFIEAQPLLVLVRAEEEKPRGDSRLIKSSQCLSMCWSLSKGHNIIACGYTNGFIGMFDIEEKLQTTSEAAHCFNDNFKNTNVDMFVKDGIKHLKSISYFFVGEKKVHDIVLHYDSNGLRWLGALTQARYFVVYDIRDLCKPIIVKTTTPRVIMNNSFWSPIWEPLVVCFGEAAPNVQQSVAGFIPTNVAYKRNRLDCCNSGISRLDYNASFHAVAYGGENGDLVIMQPRELFLTEPMPRQKKDAVYMFSTMDVLQLDGHPLVRPHFEVDTLGKRKAPTAPQLPIKKDEDRPTQQFLLHPEYKQKYALMFTPLTNFKREHQKALYSESRRPFFGLEPMMRINALRFCPNQNPHARGLLAACYENGFLRMVHMKNSNVFPNLKKTNTS